MSKKPTVCGVQVHTWGASYGAGSGIWSYIKESLYGGSVGHASITVIIPVNENTEELIDKYCRYSEFFIPHKRRKIKFADGQSEEVYEIYFSAWPEEGSNEIFLAKDLNKDKSTLLYYYNFNWNDSSKSVYDIQNKIATGLLGKRKISIGPFSIERFGMDISNEEERAFLLLSSEKAKFNEKLKLLELLKSILSECISDERIFVNSESKKFLLKNALPEQKIGKLLKKPVLIYKDIKEVLDIVEDELLLLKKTISINAKKIEKMHIYEMDQNMIHEKYLSLGIPESGLVSLPINNKLADNIGFDNGLDVEAMLLKMQSILESGVLFDLFDKNCSEFVANILESGVSQPHLKKILDERTFFGMNTPQMLYNSSLKLQSSILNNDVVSTSIWHKMKVFDLSLNIKKVMKSLISFSNKHKFFIPVGLPLLSTLIIAFVVVKIVVFPINVLGGFFAKIKSVNIVDDKFVNDDSHEDVLSSLDNEQNLENSKDQILKNHIDAKVQEVNVLDPVLAISEFASILKNPEAIPVFSYQTFLKLKKNLDKNNDSPIPLIKVIKKLDLPLPKDLDYKKLDSLLDALQLLAAQRVSDNTKVLHDLIKNRKITLQNTEKCDAKDRESYDSENHNPNIKTNKPDLNC